jgi:hypothetical protein
VAAALVPGIACDLFCTPSVSREYFAAVHGRQGELPMPAATRPLNPMISLRAEISPALRRGCPHHNLLDAALQSITRQFC